MAEDAGFGVVVVNPNLFSAIPFQFFTERRTAGIFGSSIGIAVADANQTVGDVAGRLDFDVAVADGIAAFVITCAPSKVFGAFTAFAADVVINTAGAWIPAFQRCPVFKGAILGTPPDQVGAEFFLVFGFVAKGSRFPDAFVAVADGIAVVVRAAEFALLAVRLILGVFPKEIFYVGRIFAICASLVAHATPKCYAT